MRVPILAALDTNILYTMPRIPLPASSCDQLLGTVKGPGGPLRTRTRLLATGLRAWRVTGGHC